MPTYINERPVKTGCWTDREDELLAEWQGKYGNRYVLPVTVPCHAWAATQLCSQYVRLTHETSSFADCAAKHNITFATQYTHTSAASLKVVHGSEEDLRQDWSAMRSALATQGKPSILYEHGVHELTHAWHLV